MSISRQFQQGRAKPSQDADDRPLIQRIVAGDGDAMTELYERYYPRLFNFLYRLSRNYGLTEEVVNDVMLVVWRDAGKYRGSSKVSTWIFGIGYRQCIKRMRRKPLLRAARIEPGKRQFDGFAVVELDEVLSIALDELSAEHRMMIESVLYLGMTYGEIAEIVDCPVGTAKTRVHHARKRLRASLKRLGYRSGADIG